MIGYDGEEKGEGERREKFAKGIVGEKRNDVV